LLEKLADSVSLARATCAHVVRRVAGQCDALKDATVGWLRLHAQEISHGRADFGRTLVHILVGLVIGVMVSLTDLRPREVERPLASALAERMSDWAMSFAHHLRAGPHLAINTFLTAVFLLVGLPTLGVHLPLAKTLVVLTFVWASCR